MTFAHNIINKYKDLEPTEVERQATDGYYDDNGEWVNDSQETIEVTLSSQALNGRELDLLPEGERRKTSKKIYIPSEINLSYIPRYSDIIIIGGVRFKPIQIIPYMKIGMYYKVIAVAENG